MRDYSWKQFRADLGAGIVVGLVALPLAMAFAIASGVPPERGLYTAVIAGLLISALGGSRVQIGGPTGAFVVIVAGIVAKFGYEGLALATLMAGVILIILGLSRLGTLVKFIPHPVITGFTSGIAVIIFSSQMHDFFGLKMVLVPTDFIEKWRAYMNAFPTFNPWAVLIATITVGVMALWPRSWRRTPSPIVAMVAVTAAASFFHWPVETIGSRFGGIPHGLPSPLWPQWSWVEARMLIPSAITIAMLGAVESLLSAVVADGMIGGRHKSNIELVAQGIANLASPIFGGIPATGAIARTATNVNNGGRTPVAGIVHALVLLCILLMAGPLAARIPLATLSGILVMVSYHMAEWRSFQFHLTGQGSDRLILLTTFMLTVFVDLSAAVAVGMVLASFLFMRNMAELTEVKALTHEDHEEEGKDLLQVPPGVEIFMVRGALFFAAVHKLMELDRIIAAAPHILILDMSHVPHMDGSGLHMLQRLKSDCKKRGTRFLIAGIHSQPLLVLKKADQLQLFGEENMKKNLSAALAELQPS